MTKSKNKTIEDYGTVIYKGYSGSRAYGTNITEKMAKEHARLNGGKWEDYVSDVDIRGIFIPHPQFLYGTQKVDQFTDPNEEDTVYFSLEKFLRLALDGNPNVVEQLFIRDKDVLYMHPLGKELRDNRNWFISKNAYGRFGSYAWSQLKRMTVQNEEFKRNEKRQKIIDMTATENNTRYDSKNAMHLIRLFEMGIQILSEGTLETFRKNYKELLEYRNGKYTLEQVKERAELLNLQLEDAMIHSTIPNVPDFEKVNLWAMAAVDKAHGKNEEIGVLKNSWLNILPVEYEMVDRTTLFLVSNPLVRKLSKSESQGMVVPYKDWFTGLRDFNEFKFEKTTIEFIHKFVHQVQACNPRHIDTIFAPKEKFLHRHFMSAEFLDKMKTLPSTKRAFHTAKGYVLGNLKKMEHWEKIKQEHNAFKEKVVEAKKLNESDWKQRFEELEKSTLNVSMRQLNSVQKEYETWLELSQKKGNLPFYPDIPNKTPKENASAMGKFGYDTILASELFHVLKMYIELLGTGTIKNSRSYEPEMYSIRHGKYKSFNEFSLLINQLLEELEESKNRYEFHGANHDEIQEWLISFIQKYHETLN